MAAALPSFASSNEARKQGKLRRRAGESILRPSLHPLSVSREGSLKESNDCPKGSDARSPR